MSRYLRVSKRTDRCEARKKQDSLLFKQRFSLLNSGIGFVSPSRIHYILRNMLQRVLMFTNVSLNNFLTHLLQKSILNLGWKHNTPKTALRELCLVLQVQVSLAPWGGFMEQYIRYIHFSSSLMWYWSQEIQKGIELPGYKSWSWAENLW